MEIIGQHEDKGTIDGQWKEIIGHLRWLLSQSLIFNFNSNNDTEETLYVSSHSNDHQNCGRIVTANDLRGLVKWFPELAVEQIRKNVNSQTFLVDSLPPKPGRDVELNREGEVSAWKFFNHLRDGKMVMTPVDERTEGSVLQRLTPRLDPIQRFGLVFDKGQQNVYHMAYAENFLRNKGTNTVLTMTFLV